MRSQTNAHASFLFKPNQNKIYIRPPSASLTLSSLLNQSSDHHRCALGHLRCQESQFFPSTRKAEKEIGHTEFITFSFENHSSSPSVRPIKSKRERFHENYSTAFPAKNQASSPPPVKPKPAMWQTEAITILPKNHASSSAPPIKFKTEMWQTEVIKSKPEMWQIEVIKPKTEMWQTEVIKSKPEMWQTEVIKSKPEMFTILPKNHASSSAPPVKSKTTILPKNHASSSAPPVKPKTEMWHTEVITFSNENHGSSYPVSPIKPKREILYEMGNGNHAGRDNMIIAGGNNVFVMGGCNCRRSTRPMMRN